MSTFASQGLTVADSPIGFDLPITRDPMKIIRNATFRVEGTDVRINLVRGQDPSPTHNGTLAFDGQWVWLRSEEDIENFSVISANAGSTAYLYTEFSDDEVD